ncbi:MAG: hypothetical protein SXG53_02440 [Pseudomonadota bacterium]|nr:hypothetical protein [Pseudomonadota bacterium]
MSGRSGCAELAALRAAVLQDLMETTDADLTREAATDGEDLIVIGAGIKKFMRNAAATTLRERLAAAKRSMSGTTSVNRAQTTRPPVEHIKQVIQELFQRDSSLGLAFRDGKRQSESDWQSLYDDLVTLGSIKPDDDGH